MPRSATDVPSSWTSATAAALAIAAGGIFLGSNEKERASCDFLYMPSFLGWRNKSGKVSEEELQKLSSRKRNNTMALIESFDPSASRGIESTSTPLSNNSSSRITTVNDKYKADWQDPLGMGAFGGVFKGIERSTGKAVAIKQIPKNCTEYVAFQREMGALAAIAKAGGHPNINNLRETFVGGRSRGGEGAEVAPTDELHDDDNYYLVLDLISGSEMFDQLCEKGAYSEGKKLLNHFARTTFASFTEFICFFLRFCTADAARLVRQVASALAFLHDLGIVHSDLKRK